MSAQVSVIIPHYGEEKLLAECLSSIAHQTYKEIETVVINNTCQELRRIEKQFQNVKFIHPHFNLGFGKAVNLGIKNSKGEYILVLNNDTVLERDCIENLLKAPLNLPGIGMLAPKVLYYSQPEIINSVGILVFPDFSTQNRGLNQQDKGQFNTIEEVFGPSGAAAFYKRRMLQELGGFIEYYFLYHEEDELAWRAQLNNWRCLYVPNARVYHHRSYTTRCGSLLKAFYSERNRIWNIAKFLPFDKLPTAVICSFWRYILFLLRGKTENSPVPKEKVNFFKLLGVISLAWIDAFLKLAPVLKERKTFLKISPNFLLKRRFLYANWREILSCFFLSVFILWNTF